MRPIIGLDMVLFTKCLLIGLLVVLAGFAARASLQNAALADHVAYGATADGKSLITISDEKSRAMAATCRSNIFAPGLRLHILRLNQLDSTRNYDAWYKAVSASEQYAAEAIRCAPFRGDTWIRSAQVSQFIAEDPRRLSAMIQYAAALNPVERSQLIARMALWSRVSAETHALSRSLIARDIDLLLRYGEKPMVLAALRSNSPLLRELALSTLENMPADRRKKIEAMNEQ